MELPLPLTCLDHSLMDQLLSYHVTHQTQYLRNLLFRYQNQDTFLETNDHTRKIKNTPPNDNRQISQPITLHQEPTFDLTQYIQTHLIKINGIDYLIDSNGIIFDNSEIHLIVGRNTANTSDVDQIQWFCNESVLKNF
jgi:hypothetical protein